MNARTSLRIVLTAAAISWCLPAAAATETVLHVFQENTNDGFEPEVGLQMDAAGRLYGTTLFGGAADFGMVFRLDPPTGTGGPWTEWPQNTLIADAKGNLYGTTEEAGESDLGVAFRLAPPVAGASSWTQTVLHAFGGSEGGQPTTGVTALDDGSLVGGTFQGGSLGAGTVYRLLPPAQGTAAWTVTVLHAFSGGADGGQPTGNLLSDRRGGFYGKASQGGSHRQGVTFHLVPGATASSTWDLIALHAFEGGVDGGGPTGNLMLDAGRLYGVTLGGVAASSTVYRIDER